MQQIETEINIASKEETKVLNHPNKVPSNEENMSIGADNVIAYRNIKTPDNPSNCNLVVPKSLYKVILKIAISINVFQCKLYLTTILSIFTSFKGSIKPTSSTSKTRLLFFSDFLL